MDNPYHNEGFETELPPNTGAPDTPYDEVDAIEFSFDCAGHDEGTAVEEDLVAPHLAYLGAVGASNEMSAPDWTDLAAETPTAEAVDNDPFDPESTGALPEWQLLIGENVAATPGADERDPLVEARRTQMSIKCAREVYHGDTTKFGNLTAEQRADLQAQTQGIGDEEALEVFSYGLLTHDIGKNEKVREAIGAGAEMDHDQVYTELVSNPAHIEARQRLMPGFDNLPQWGQQVLIAMSQVKSNYAQTLQGEAPAETLTDISQAEDPRVVQWDIPKAKYDIFGAAGHVNQEISLTATPSTYRRMSNLDAALLDPNLETPQDRNNAFLDREIADLMGPVQAETPEQLAKLHALARLECHMRTPDETKFAALREDFEAQPPVVKQLLIAELNRTGRATLAYYSPELVRAIARKEGGKHALLYFAHVLQEAHIADIEERKAGMTGVATLQLDGLIRSIQSGEFNTRASAMRFELQDGALVAVPRRPTLETLDGIPEFADGESLRGKRVLFMGEGGGSDCIQAAMLGKLMANRYGCEVAAVVSSRNERRVVANAGEQVGPVTRQITSETTPVGDWRFLESIPLESEGAAPMYLVNSTDPWLISQEVQTLVDLTHADVVIGVDTGGDSLYTSTHAGFSARRETDITPDHDYNTIQALAQAAEERGDNLRVLSTIVYPGVDSPPYARQVMDQIGATQMSLNADEVAMVRKTYADWRMDGSGSEEGRYGKTPLAGLHALQGHTGLQVLDLPVQNVTSTDNPWRAFTTIAPAMSGIVLADMRDHFAAIERSMPEGPPEHHGSPRTQEIFDNFTPISNVLPTWDGRYMYLQFERPGSPDEAAARKGIGGEGVTSRTLGGLKAIVPGLREELLTEQGKIVFLGNGLSNAPLEVLEQRGDAPAPEIVLLDALNYQHLLTDLQRLKSRMEINMIEVAPDLEQAIYNCSRIVDAAAAGRVKLVQHIIGDSEPPKEVKNADLAVNVFGPPESTIDLQIACLKPDGRLYVGDVVPPSTTKATVTRSSQQSSLGYLIKPNKTQE